MKASLYSGSAGKKEGSIDDGNIIKYSLEKLKNNEFSFISLYKRL